MVDVIDKNSFIVYEETGGEYIFDANKDTITTSFDVDLISLASRTRNNNIPNDMYKKKDTLKFVRESNKTKYIDRGHERVYDLKKYDFDLVYENEKY